MIQESMNQIEGIERKNLCDYIIYTDGAYSPLRDQGGVGIVVVKNGEKVIEFSKVYKNTTNNQMELLAVILALSSVKNKIKTLTIITDSQYVIGCATKGWKRKKNKTLWENFDKALIRAQSLCPDIKFEWTKGHEDNEFNNLADTLASSASLQYIR